MFIENVHISHQYKYEPTQNINYRQICNKMSEKYSFKEHRLKKRSTESLLLHDRMREQ